MTPAQLIVKVAGLFPRAFPSEAAISTWLDTYQTTLGHLKPDQLETAWNRTITAWEKTSPPLPKHILDNVPSKARGPARSDSKSRYGLAEALPTLMEELMREWWRANAHWFDAECDARCLTSGQKDAARWWTNSFLRRAANYQAQIVYWKDDTSPVTLPDADIGSIFSLASEKPNPISAFGNVSMGGLKAAYVRDGKKAVKYDRRYSWMDQDETHGETVDVA